MWEKYQKMLCYLWQKWWKRRWLWWWSSWLPYHYQMPIYFDQVAATVIKIKKFILRCGRSTRRWRGVNQSKTNRWNHFSEDENWGVLSMQSIRKLEIECIVVTWVEFSTLIISNVSDYKILYRLKVKNNSLKSLFNQKWLIVIYSSSNLWTPQKVQYFVKRLLKIPNVHTKQSRSWRASIQLTLDNYTKHIFQQSNIF